MSGFEIPKINLFNEPIGAVGAVKSRSVQSFGQNSGPTFGASGGLTPYEKDMADFRQYLPAYNGTGQLQPKNSAGFDIFG